MGNANKSEWKIMPFDGCDKSINICCGEIMVTVDYDDAPREKAKSIARFIASLKEIYDESAKRDVRSDLERAMKALKTIRHAGRNDHPTAIWMQKVAAHAMEPDRWPSQPDQPPSDGFAGDS